MTTPTIKNLEVPATRPDAFDLDDDLYAWLEANGAAFTANGTYLRTAITLGQNIYLYGPALVHESTALYRELQLLQEEGVFPILVRRPF